MAMFGRALAEYLAIMWSNWTGRVSGPLSFFFTFAACYSEWIAKQPKALLWILAGVAYVVASFSVFYKTRPNLDIEIEHAYLDDGFSCDQHKGAHVTLSLLLTNTRQEANSIRRFKLTVGNKKESRTGVSEATDRIVSLRGTLAQSFIDLELFKHQRLQQGVPEFGWVRFALEGIIEMGIRGRTSMLSVTDAYKRQYDIRFEIPDSASAAIKQMGLEVTEQQLCINRLMELSEQGNIFLGLCRSTYPVPREKQIEIDQWEETTARCIEQCSDKARRLLFLSDGDLKESTFPAVSVAHRTIITRVNTRLSRLNEVIRELREDLIRPSSGLLS